MRAGYRSQLDLFRTESVSEVRALYSFEGLGVRMIREQPEPSGPVICSPEDAYPLVEKLFEGADREMFYSLLLNGWNKVIGVDLVSIGTLSQTLVHPREVYKTAIHSSASSLILAHNHPSGEARPSDNDVELTRRLVQVGELVGIKVLDHVIYAHDGPGWLSFQEMGIL